MQIVAIVSLVLLVGSILGIFLSKTERNSIVAVALTVVMLIVTLITGWLAIAPEYRFKKAEIEKRILVEQAKAEADAAVEEARAEIERARGTAEANKIVANSITEPYLRYLYINNLSKTDNQVIYLPTEAGLPILEAERLAK